MRILRRIPATSGEVSAGGGVTSGVYQGSGGLYFTIGEVGLVNAAVVTTDGRSDQLRASGRITELRYQTVDEDSNLRNNQVRVELLQIFPLASGGSTIDMASGTDLSGLGFIIDAEAEV
ncbi:MAG: hypothetical protein Q8R28_18985 [Dehalococcoidia bacterium]|nr:hypothetical protein [Dehalococcoidia bacterium]